jgi:hypothetical protein
VEPSVRIHPHGSQTQPRSLRRRTVAEQGARVIDWQGCRTRQPSAAASTSGIAWRCGAGPLGRRRWCESPVTIHWQWRDYLRMRSGRDSLGESAHFTPRRDPPIARLAAGRRRINDSRPSRHRPGTGRFDPFRTFGPMNTNRDFCDVGTFPNGAIRLWPAA